MSEHSHCNHPEITPEHHTAHCASCNSTFPVSSSGQENTPSFSQRTEAAGLTIEAGFLFFALTLLLLGSTSGFRQLVGDLSISFVAIMLEALPFMLLGSIAGGLIESFVPQEWVSRVLGGRNTIFVAAGLGTIFPVCECAIVPIVRRLLNKRVPFSAAIAFLLGVPIVNPIVAGSTWLAYRFDWSFLATRMICGYVIAVVIALIMDFLFRNKQALLNGPSNAHDAICGCEHNHDISDKGKISKLFEAFRHASDDFFDVGRFLVIGAFIAALARTVIGIDALRELFYSPAIAIIMMMGLAIALNLCSETDAFIAAGFRGVLPDTAQMAFMVLGPMLDTKLLLMYLAVFRKRTIVIMSVLIFLMVLSVMMLLQYVLGGLPGGQ